MRPGLRALATAALLGAALLGGCIRTPKGEAGATFEQMATAPYEPVDANADIRLARRYVPWSRETAVERTDMAPLPASPSELADGATPGLFAAGERLAARDRLRRQLAAAIGVLEASDPIPGETAGATVAELATKHRAVADAVAAALDRGVREELLPGGESKPPQLEARAALEPVAAAVLAAGGGRRMTAEQVRAAAEADALANARRQLFDKLLAEKSRKGQKVAEWVGDDPVRRRALELVVAEAETIHSTDLEVGDGKREWMVVLALPEAELRQLLEGRGAKAEPTPTPTPRPERTPRPPREPRPNALGQ
ncbi:MAG: hypothetical protein SF028_14625 [Candidatus Sumerlaeia bacterium]|nr:hypothetical protein [Candidatus Sumerlaeia bacterium]